VPSRSRFSARSRAAAPGANQTWDLAIRAGPGFSAGGFDHFGRLESLRERLAVIVGRDVDLVEESVARPALREAIRREAIRAF
jgi:predicted nucleotidyltransferase